MNCKFMAYDNGFAKEQFIEHVVFKTGQTNAAYLSELLENICAYGMKWHRVSKDSLCYFISDLLPDIEFLEVASYCEDAILTDSTIKQKEKYIKANEVIACR